MIKEKTKKQEADREEQKEEESDDQTVHGEEILCKIQTHNQTTRVAQRGAIQMSEPHFTCGSVWPSTSLLSLLFTYFPLAVPCLVSHHPISTSAVLHDTVSDTHKSLRFPLVPDLLLPNIFPLHLSIYPMANQNIHFLKIEAHRSQIKSSRTLVDKAPPLTKEDQCLRTEAYSVWYNSCHTACFPNCYFHLFIHPKSKAVHVVWAVHADMWTAFLFILFREGSDRWRLPKWIFLSVLWHDKDVSKNDKKE